MAAPPEVQLSPVARRVIVCESQASADGRETGGILLGFDADLDERYPITITVAGGPGPAADRRTYRFRRDLEHTQALADEAYGIDGSVWVGEWHTHPMGGGDPSRVDLSAYWQVLDTGVMPALTAIIVVPGIDGSLKRPRLHAWAIGSRTCERAVLI